MEKLNSNIVNSGFVNITIRKSVMFIVIRLIVLEFITLILFTVFGFIPMLLGVKDLYLTFASVSWFPIFGNNLIKININWANIILWLNLILLILNLIFTAKVFLDWLDTSYVITPTHITIKYGIFNTHLIEYNLNHFQSFVAEQNFLGKLFNYGNIKMYNPFTKEYVSILDIPDPFKYIEILESLSTKPQQKFY